MSRDAEDKVEPSRPTRSARRWWIVGFLVLGAVAAVVVLFRGKVESDPEPIAAKPVETPLSAIVSDASADTVPSTETETTPDDGISLRPPRSGEHPLDPALDRARQARQRIADTIADYTGTLVKRERVAGELTPQAEMAIKVRQEVREGETITTPFSIYLKFESPKAKAGQEAIWVQGRHDGRLVGHEGAGANFITRGFRAWVAPEGTMAMRGEKYPIFRLGLDEMLVKLLERGTDEKQFDDLRISQVATEVNGRPTTLWKIEHTDPKPEHGFHTAEISIDDEWKLPVRYRGFILPAGETEPVLDEEYEYKNLKFNVGLADHDFDPDNPDYGYPSLLSPIDL